MTALLRRDSTYWKAGLSMVQDYPLGAGGDGFHTQHGSKYLNKLGYHFASRSVHNGYINEMCDWGIQGIVLRLIFLASCALAARETAMQCNQRGDPFGGMLGASLIAGMTAFAVQSVFGDFLDNEWGYWFGGICIAYSYVYAPRAAPTLQRQMFLQPHQLPPQSQSPATCVPN